MLIGSVLLSTVLFAQQINGNIKDGQGNGINNATVSLLLAKDSSVSKLGVTKSDGGFSFTGIKAGKYLVSASHVGYQPFYSTAFDFDGNTSITLPVMDLRKASKENTCETGHPSYLYVELPND